jgi:DNA polymerase-3 subunit alpha
MRDYLRRSRPDKITDLIALNALYRPGPLGSGMAVEGDRQETRNALELTDLGYHPDSLPGKNELGNGPGLSEYDLFIGIL